jgi:hypothetical protein
MMLMPDSLCAAFHSFGCRQFLSMQHRASCCSGDGSEASEFHGIAALLVEDSVFIF